MVISMTFTNENEIAKHIKQGNLESVYFICGDDEYLKQSAVKAIIKSFFKSKVDDMNFTKMDANSLDMDKLSDSVEAMPFFASRRLVQVDGINIDSVLKGDREKLKEIIKNPNPSTVQIYYASQWKQGERISATTNNFISQVDKVGAVIRFSKRDKAGLVKFIKSKAQTYGCEIDQKLCQKLTEYCSMDMQRLITETDKLFAYRAGGTIIEDDIEAVVTADVQARVFDLWTKIFRKDYIGTMELLGDLFYLREEPIAILGALSMNVCDIYRVKLGDSDGNNVGNISKQLGIKSTFRLNKAGNFSRKISLSYLRKAIDILKTADIRLKSSPMNGKIILEQAVTMLFVAAQEETSN